MIFYRLRIASWYVGSTFILIVFLLGSTYFKLEEELRMGKTDPTHPAHEGWKLHNSFAEAEIEDIISEVVHVWLWIALPLLAVSIAGGLFIARRSLRPIRGLNLRLAAMDPGKLRGDIPVPEDDPAFRDLAEHLNSLLERAGAAYQQQAEFSAQVAHELRTPLMILRAKIERERAGMPADLHEDLHEELVRLHRFVERALLAAKAEGGTLAVDVRDVDVVEVLRELREGYAMLAAAGGVDFQMDLQGPELVRTDPDLLLRALHGLLENAVKYAACEVRVGLAVEGGMVRIDVENDRVDGDGKVPGLGLGLRLVRAITHASGMEFEVRTSSSRFCARLLVPLSAAAAGSGELRVLPNKPKTL